MQLKLPAAHASAAAVELPDGDGVEDGLGVGVLTGVPVEDGDSVPHGAPKPTHDCMSHRPLLGGPLTGPVAHTPMSLQ